MAILRHLRAGQETAAVLRSQASHTLSDASVSNQQGSSSSLLRENASASTLLGTSSSKSSIENDSEISQAKRAYQAASVTFTPAAVDTNETFANWLCTGGTVGADTLDLSIGAAIGSHPTWFLMPQCLATAAPNLLSFGGTNVVITTFDVFSATLKSMTVTGLFGPEPTQGDNTYFVGGKIQWSQVWQRLPQLTTFAASYSNLKGFLPTPLPWQMVDLKLDYAELTGTIDSGFFAMPTLAQLNTPRSNLAVSFRGNRITGPLSTVFNNLNGQKWINGVALSFLCSENDLSGTIPSTLFTPLVNSAITTLSFDASSNQLSGSLPTNQNFIPAGIIASAGNPSFILNLHMNALTGTLPTAFLDNVSPTAGISLFLSSNLLSGSLPSTLTPAGYAPNSDSTPLIISLYNNSFVGQIPSTLLSANLGGNATVHSITIDLHQNQFSGSIPEKLLYRSDVVLKKDAGAIEDSAAASFVSISAVNSLNINLGNNLLEGVLPAGLMAYSGFPSSSYPLSPSFFISLDLTLNSVGGVIPDGLLNSIPGAATVIFNANSNRFSGSPPSACAPLAVTVLSLMANRLDGTIPNAWEDCNFESISLLGNSALTGTIPSKLFNATKTFNAAGTALYGPLPSSATKNVLITLTGLYRLEMCSRSDAFSTISNHACELSNTEACNCPTLFSKCDMDDCSQPVAPVPYSGPTAPIALPMPSSYPTVATPTTAAPQVISPPLSSPTPSNPTCPNATRPSGNEWICVGTVWTSTNASTIIIPSGVGTVVIPGSINTTVIEIHGLGSIVEIGGTADLLKTISIEFTISQANALGSVATLQKLISFSNGTVANLGTVSVNANVVSGGCRKVKVQKVLLDDGASLGAYFTLDKSGCKTWWIILVSVLCGLVVVAVVIIVLLAVFWKPFREKIRPYSKSREHAKGEI